MSDFSAAQLVTALRENGLLLVCAESCTAGMLSASIAEVSGASEVLWGAFVSYRVNAKSSMFSVPEQDFERWGAVSAETAAAMCRGALVNSPADIAISTVCYAEPNSVSEITPHGWVASQRRTGTVATRFVPLGLRERNRNREEMVRSALQLLSWTLGLTA